MSYVDPDYKSKKDFKAAVAAGECHTTYYPFPWMLPTRQNGSDVIEGPHFPKPHRWSAKVRVQNGVVVSCEGADLGSQPPVVPDAARE